RKTSSGVDDVAVVAEVIFAGLGAAVIGDRLGRTVLTAGAARIAELRDPRVDRMIDLEIERRCHAAHSEQGAQLRMNDRAVPSKFSEAGFQSDGDVEQIAVANRVFDLARVPERSQIRRKLDDGLAKREVHAQALDRRLSRRDDLK